MKEERERQRRQHVARFWVKRKTEYVEICGLKGRGPIPCTANIAKIRITDNSSNETGLRKERKKGGAVYDAQGQTQTERGEGGGRRKAEKNAVASRLYKSEGQVEKTRSMGLGE